MRRPLTITVLVVIFVIGDVAWAETPDQPTRLPMAFNETASSQQVTVETGDHLWRISARHLVDAKSASPIAPYWRKVIDLNLSVLRSGDPDLIYAGEVVVLPEPGD